MALSVTKNELGHPDSGAMALTSLDPPLYLSLVLLQLISDLLHLLAASMLVPSVSHSRT
jgi:hypothetical protein